MNIITNFITISFGDHEYLLLHYKYRIPIKVYIEDSVMIGAK